jgi:hypothetical protein
VSNEPASGLSQFTSWLVEGVDKGEAAPEDEQITMDALYRYLARRARVEGSVATPQRFVHGGVGDLVISANPLAGSLLIDPGIMAALAAEEFRTRLGAVAELTLQMEEVNTVTARRARRVLEHHLGRERDYVVRAAITNALSEEREKPTRPSRTDVGGLARQVFDQSGIGVARATVLSKAHIAVKLILFPLWRAVAYFLSSIFFWPLKLSWSSGLLKGLIFSVWIVVLTPTIYLIYLFIAGILDYSAQSPIHLY